MHYLLEPVAFSIGIFSVRWYGIILGCGALAGLLLAVREGRRFRIQPDFFMDLLLIGVPSAVICARIYYVAFRWPDYSHNISEAFKVWHGGIAIHGALIGAVIAAVIYVRYKGYNFWRIADICAPSLLIGQLIGRWGNFMNQEAFGGPVEPSFLTQTLHLPAFIVNQMWIEGQYHHPTFLYESVWNLVGLFLLFWLRRRPFMRAGELFMTYFIWYSIGRFFVEGLRTDSLAFYGPDWLVSLMRILWSPMTLLFQPGHMEEGFGDVRIAQVIGVVIILAAVAIIVLRRRLGYAREHYADPIVSTREPKESLDEPAAAREETASEAADESFSAPANPDSVQTNPDSAQAGPAPDSDREEISTEYEDVAINPVTGEVISRGIRKKDDGPQDG